MDEREAVRLDGGGPADRRVCAPPAFSMRAVGQVTDPER